MRPAALAATLSGRTDERDRLLDLVHAGLGGSPRTLLVHGEAGIGKTSLVRSVCEEVAGEGAQVLWGQSLRFGAVEAMYHPLVLALEGWLGEADDSGRASVIEAVPGAALILPSLGASPTEGHSMLMMVVDALLSRVIARGPTVLVVDDVQWADPATWDALSYLVAGFGHQRLTLVTTHRDEPTVTEQFQHWLGNLRRLPGTEELVLTRLDQEATGDQIAELLGRVPSGRLLEQVYEKSRGNPYFSELLVRRGDLAASELPDDLPDELSQALLQAWRGMSDPARETARILAIGGRPSDLRTLTAIAAGLGLPQAGSIREAVDAGVVVFGEDGAWFRHPLLADVLAQTYLPGEAAPVHAAWAAHLESLSADGVDELRRLGDLASHHERAGDASGAFAPCSEAPNSAKSSAPPARPPTCWSGRPTYGSPVPSPPTPSAERGCSSERASPATGRAKPRRLPTLPLGTRSGLPERDPLWASRLTARVARLAFNLGETSQSPSPSIQRVVELSRVDPDSREHAEALTVYANFLFWAERHRRRMSGGRRGGRSRRPLGICHRDQPGPWIRPNLLSETNLRQADAGRDGQLGACPRLGRSRCRLASYHQAVDRVGKRRPASPPGRCARPLQLAAPRGNTVEPCVVLPDVLLAMGDLLAAEDIVRAGLATIGPANNEARIRLQAGLLAARQGRA